MRCASASGGEGYGAKRCRGHQSCAAERLRLPGRFCPPHGLRRASVLKVLAEADAFRSIGLDRRQALWAVARYHETGTPAAASSDLPLFAEAAAIPHEPVVALPSMPLGEHVLTDYASVRLSLKAHPMALLRRRSTKLGYVKPRTSQPFRSRTDVKAAGIVLIRQRPGSANGVIFSTSRTRPASPTDHLAEGLRTLSPHVLARRAYWACAASCNASKASFTWSPGS